MMMKKPAHTLLAVTLAVSPVAADPDRWDPPPVSVQPPAPTEMQASALLDGMFAVFGIARPRVLASGAPACGNVQGKAPPPADCLEPAPITAYSQRAEPR